MRAIVVMFDSLNRHGLSCYGAQGVITPNFDRLAARCATFDTCYAGSMPCMPARRELHTGRYNFLHRSWGPLEPFDDSVPEMLDRHGVHTHLATDHQHYWEDGGATYHTRYSTFSLIRGQQGDPWKGEVAGPPETRDLRISRRRVWQQDQINRKYMTDLADHPQVRTFDAGVEFIRTNHREDNWMVQIETFDPHEPFFSNPKYHALHDTGYSGPEYEWPDYKQVVEDDDVVAYVRGRYAALVTMCDESLGRVMDLMDELSMWDDTMLVVCTDHGFLLGEHGWWGKMAPPWYDETIHTPLLIWDPRSGPAGKRRSALVQTIDIAPTLLDLFGLEPTSDMQGIPLRDTIAGDTSVRQYALFGGFGGHVSITDGRFVYMRASADPSNGPLFEHTLMPTHMRARFRPEELHDAELVGPFSFTKGAPVLRTAGHVMTKPYAFGTLLYDLQADPQQASPMVNDVEERRLCQALVDLMRETEAPSSQFERLGLPLTGPVGEQHLLAAAQHEQAVRGSAPAPPPESYPSTPYSVHSTVGELMNHPPAAAVLERHLGDLAAGPFVVIASDVTLYRAATAAIGLMPWEKLTAIATDLAKVNP